MAWCFEDEASLRTDAVLNQAEHLVFVVPALWRWEVANVLRMAERRARVTPQQTSAILLRLSRLNIVLDDASALVPQDQLVALARQHSLTVYDTAYLELAMRLQLPLATFDQPLETAAKTAGIEVL